MVLQQSSIKLFDPLTQFLNNILTTGQISPSWNSAKIIVVPKKDKDLLNTVILTYLITKSRPLWHCSPNNSPLYSCWPNGIHPSLGLTNKIYKTMDTIQYYKIRHKKLALLLSLDIQKAFDQVETRYLLELLHKMNFGPNFPCYTQYIHPLHWAA